MRFASSLMVVLTDATDVGLPCPREENVNCIMQNRQRITFFVL